MAPTLLKTFFVGEDSAAVLPRISILSFRIDIWNLRVRVAILTGLWGFLGKDTGGDSCDLQSIKMALNVSSSGNAGCRRRRILRERPGDRQLDEMRFISTDV